MIAPETFSPSSLSQFMSCPLAFKYSYIDKRPVQPQIAATRGTIVHRSLELLFKRSPENRNVPNCFEDLELAFEEYEQHPDLLNLNLNHLELNQLKLEAKTLVENYFQIEDPTKIIPVGLEVKLQASIEDTIIRGIIDRLELDEKGDLVVTDYKTGKAPRENQESSKLNGVNLYALLCREILGVLPAKVQLIYLGSPAVIVATPSSSTLKGVQQRSRAIKKAVDTACDKNDFRPNPSALCPWCSFQELCPAKGGKIPND